MGWLELKAGLKGLTSLTFVEYPGIDTGSNYYLEMAETQLKEYFAGRRRDFAIPLDPEGTEFDKLTWNAVKNIGFGVSTSYSRIARQIGSPSAGRAVGSANGRNPIAIFIPCHRVVAENGNLTGYSGGLKRKRWLLDWEKRDSEPKLFNSHSLGNSLYK